MMRERRHQDSWVETPPLAGRGGGGVRRFRNINNPNEIVCTPEPRHGRGGAMPGYYVVLTIPGGHLPHTEVNNWIAADDFSWFLDYLFGLKKYDKRIKFTPPRQPRRMRGVPRKPVKSKVGAA